MARRVSLPPADDLFRPTAPVADGDAAPAPPAVPAPADGSASASAQPAGARRPSGRVKHDEKMTVYVTSAELLDIEQARLRLRAELGTAVDRGRLVREAVALALADLEENGEASALARRLRGEG
ncbi:hypothetical protein INN71_14345 [Nocardioides sp. ChNu-153]|uniref:hypothetical protein n=1 Tax=unclassified Nocardioides TaxID=2615069 RepID=UPI002407261E|nr:MULTISPECIES: hypothetical protein [unclassified Nocardioides]MDF9715220.1 hypothetical protein [Nocardioides sp. ChNu-99]MDN7122569.1 hypothetical protein [Nocardioides sp. ChNu-153]